MMYRILLVDDEPLILSGIKFLLDWNKNNCQIIDTARNGQDALNKIRSQKPDIVLCDINMPVMSGIDLLQIISEEMPFVVFIMLTNLQDFDLVKSALKFRAVDYVVKSQLEAEALEASLANAQKEFDNRNQLANVGEIEDQKQVISELLWKEILLHPSSSAKMKDMADHLSEELVLDSYAVLTIMMDYDENSNCQNREELFSWEKELIDAMAQKHFTAFTLLEPDNACDSIMLLCHGVTDDLEKFKRLTRQFYQKLSSSSANITRVSIRMMVTECFHGSHTLSECRNQRSALMDYYYNTEQDYIYAGDFFPLVCQSLGLTGISKHLLEAVQDKSSSRCSALFDKTTSRIRSVYHERSTAIWLCNELYSSIGEELQNSVPASQLSTYFSMPEIVLTQIEQLHTRSQVIAWLLYLKESTISAIVQLVSEKNNFVEAAMQYVEDHIEEHISLTDAANYVNISPTYLSSYFSKSCGQSFINYVNERKINYACKLIQENKYLIYEISNRLGFNNAYYFTKTFKRHTGKTPMEYQNAQKKSSDTL